MIAGDGPVAAAIGAPVDRHERVTGGDICDAWRLQTANARYFLKTAPAIDADMFAAEAASLAALAATGALRVPTPIAHGTDAGLGWLLLPWLEFGATTARAAATLGTALAELHRHTATQHGWQHDNFIGRSRQPNAWTDGWADFFAGQRLKPQQRLAAAQPATAALARPLAELIACVPTLLSGHTPPPALLHGDLWGGNWAALADATPVLFDPASYYGDRETDLAMTRLFGGFPQAFYDSYAAAWPLPEGHARRLSLYQLYHVLNHANLFGGGYIAQAGSMIRRLLQSVS